MMRFSGLNLFAQAFNGHRGWPEHWPDKAPKAAYDVIIIGAGGHGLGAAYYLASKYGITNVAVIEKGWLGGGNAGRNTTIIRSNYLYDESAHLYDHAVKMWDGLSQELNYNVMYSKRGVLMLAHNVHDIQSFKRHIHANRLNGVDNEWLTAEQCQAYCPPLDIAPNARHPVLGGALQRRGGTARHDSVAWGYARGAVARGVDIIQNCAVTGIRRGPDGAVIGVDTEKGFIGANKIGVSAAGSTSLVMRMAGLDFPLESYPLQALVSEPVKPIFPCVVMSNTVHAYISQSDKGELVIGAGTDQYVILFAARRALHIIEHTLAAICEIFPIFHADADAAVTWGGIVDVTPDRSPDSGQDPGAGALRQLRLGHRRVQGDPGRGRPAGAYHRARRAACDQRAL